MLLREKNAILKRVNDLSNDELADLYYNSLYDCLGSEVDRMVELDYDSRDIEERRQFEKFLNEKCSLIHSICIERGIVLFDEN